MLQKVIILCLFVCAAFSENVVVMAYSSNVGVLNPQGYNSNVMFAQNLVYEGLVALNKKGNIIPHLATSWNLSDDKLTYTFSLRKGVKFSNGEEFNANAVKINIDSIITSRARHSWSGLANALDSATILDSHTIALKLKHPYSPTLNELALIRPFRFLAPSSFNKTLDITHGFNPKPIGTGAYMLADSKLGVKDEFIKNPHYWNAKAFNGIYFDKVIIKVIVDSNAKLAALQAGQVDIIYGHDQIPLDLFKDIALNSKKYNLSTRLSPPIFSTSLILNSAKIPANECEIISKAIDKKSLIFAVYDNLQDCTDDLYISEESKPCKAKQESKIQALNKTYELMYISNNPAQKKLAQILQQQFKAIGLNLILNATESSIYHNRQTSGKFELCFNDTWGAPYEPLSSLYAMLTRGHADYAAQEGLDNKLEIRELIKRISSHANKESISKIIKLLLDSNVYIPLTMQKNKAIFKSDLKGIDMGVASYEIPIWEWSR